LPAYQKKTVIWASLYESDCCVEAQTINQYQNGSPALFGVHQTWRYDRNEIQRDKFLFQHY
jgi:hypothetical protein